VEAEGWRLEAEGGRLKAGEAGDSRLEAEG